MADRFELSGGYTTEPLGGVTSFVPRLAAEIQESVQLVTKKVGDVDLGVDTPVSVDFGGLTSANVVILKATNGSSVKATLTSAEGTAPFPFDTYVILMTREKPITAITLTRTPATPTTVEVFLGQES